LLRSQVGRGLQCVIEAIGEVGDADRQGELNDLPFIEIFAQFLKCVRAQGRSAASDPLSVQYCGLIFFVEELAAFKEQQRVNLFLGDANPLRRSGVGACSIFAAVKQGGLQVGEFFVALVNRAFRDDGTIQRKKFVQDVRAVRHERKDVGHLTEFLCKRIERFLSSGSGFFFCQRIYGSHEVSFVATL